MVLNFGRVGSRRFQESISMRLTPFFVCLDAPRPRAKSGGGALATPSSDSCPLRMRQSVTVVRGRCVTSGDGKILHHQPSILHHQPSIFPFYFLLLYQFNDNLVAMLKKLLVSLLSALLCMSVVAETEIQSNGNQNETDVKIDEKGNVFVAPLWYHISSDSTAEVIRYWYYSYKNLKSVVIPSEIQTAEGVFPVTSIEEGAFSGCAGLTNIEFSKSLTSIGAYAFSGCSGLMNVLLPLSVTSIGKGAFGGCSGLTNIEFPKSLTSIGANAFSGCVGLTFIKIPSGVTNIEPGTFAGNGLKSIEIPSGVTSIGKGAFGGCSGLRNIKIQTGVTSIGDWAFSGCRDLKRIEIPLGVTSIGNLAFSDCIGLKKIEIPSSVTNIGVFAFKNCKNLDVIIDNSEENVKVGSDAFMGCKSVKFLK